MKNQFRLEIKKPCGENFRNFSPTQKGGFCNSCEKEVIDFTGMSSKEIINYFKSNDNKKTCGRFSDYQLTTYTENQNTKKHHLLKSIGLACLSFFTLSTVTAQETKPKTEQLEQQNKNSVDVKNSKKEIIVKGKITDEDGPLPGASILLQGTSVGTESDFDGNFEFPKPLQKGDVLIFSFVGLESKKVVITNKNSAESINLNITMKTDSCMLLGEVNVTKVYQSKRKHKRK